MTRTPYPEEFYIAHALFTGDNFAPGGEWGDIADGPATWDETVEAAGEHFHDSEPDASALRVWFIRPGHPAQDVTLETITAVLEQRDEDDDSGGWAA